MLFDSAVDDPIASSIKCKLLLIDSAQAQAQTQSHSGSDLDARPQTDWDVQPHRDLAD